MIQNKYALPLSVKAFWRGDNDSTEETVTMPCDKDDTPDFYLLCDANDITVAGDWADGTENAYYALADIRDRANALQGIPTESLPEVKKAWLAWKIWELCGYYDETDCMALLDGGNYNFGSVFVASDGVSLDMDKVIKAAVKARKDGADFGELNALIDSVKEG